MPGRNMTYDSLLFMSGIENYRQTGPCRLTIVLALPLCLMYHLSLYAKNVIFVVAPIVVLQVGLAHERNAVNHLAN